MKTLYIYHHCGLGDHLTNSGIVRYKSKEYDRVYLFCKPHNIANVSFLYRDNPKIRLIAMDDAAVRSFIAFSPDNEYLIVGHSEFTKRFNSPSNTQSIDEIFYEMAGVPLSEKWDSFYLLRDRKREMEVFNSLNLEGVPYNFIHDKEGLKINPHNGLRNIRPNNLDLSLFDYLTVIERAKEIHVINSSFFCLIDTMALSHPRLHLHNLMKHTPLLFGKIKSNWRVI